MIKLNTNYFTYNSGFVGSRCNKAKTFSRISCRRSSGSSLETHKFIHKRLFSSNITVNKRSTHPSLYPSSSSFSSSSSSSSTTVITSPPPFSASFFTFSAAGFRPLFFVGGFFSSAFFSSGPSSSSPPTLISLLSSSRPTAAEENSSGSLPLLIYSSASLIPLRKTYSGFSIKASSYRKILPPHTLVRHLD